MAADFFNCTSLCLSSSVKTVGWISVLKKIDCEKQNFPQLSILKYCLICFFSQQKRHLYQQTSII